MIYQDYKKSLKNVVLICFSNFWNFSDISGGGFQNSRAKFNHFSTGNWIINGVYRILPVTFDYFVERALT